MHKYYCFREKNKFALKKSDKCAEYAIKCEICCCYCFLLQNFSSQMRFFRKNLTFNFIKNKHFSSLLWIYFLEMIYKLSL